MPLFEKIDSGDIVPLLFFVVAALVALVWIGAHYLLAHARLKQETALRKDLFDRGMTVAEVEQAMKSVNGR
jgi:hypothetical protein